MTVGKFLTEFSLPVCKTKIETHFPEWLQKQINAYKALRTVLDEDFKKYMYFGSMRTMKVNCWLSHL